HHGLDAGDLRCPPPPGHAETKSLRPVKPPEQIPQEGWNKGVNGNPLPPPRRVHGRGKGPPQGTEDCLGATQAPARSGGASWVASSSPAKTSCQADIAAARSWAAIQPR